jgi:Protein of unknown function (DUF779)/Aldehyde dehydrogenase family
VLSVTRFKDDDEALAIANDALYEPGARVWTRNGTRTYRFGRAIKAGSARVIAKLRERRGGLLFHQSRGCCDGSAMMSYQGHEFQIGHQDVYRRRRKAPHERPITSPSRQLARCSPNWPASPACAGRR